MRSICKTYSRFRIIRITFFVPDVSSRAPKGERSCNQQSLSWETPHLLCGSKVHYRVHKRPPLVRVRMNPFHTATSCSFKIHFNTVLPIGLVTSSPAVLITPVPATYISISMTSPTRMAQTKFLTLFTFNK